MNPTRRQFLGFLAPLPLLPIVGPHMLLSERPTVVGWRVAGELDWKYKFLIARRGAPDLFGAGFTREQAIHVIQQEQWLSTNEVVGSYIERMPLGESAWELCQEAKQLERTMPASKCGKARWMWQPSSHFPHSAGYGMRPVQRVKPSDKADQT